MLHGSSNQHAPNHAASTSQSDADLTEVRGDLSSLNLSGQLTPQLSIKTDRQLVGISSHSRQIPNNNGQSTISPDNIGMVTPETSYTSIPGGAEDSLFQNADPDPNPGPRSPNISQPSKRSRVSSCHEPSTVNTSDNQSQLPSISITNTDNESDSVSFHRYQQTWRSSSNLKPFLSGNNADPHSVHNARLQSG